MVEPRGRGPGPKGSRASGRSPGREGQREGAGHQKGPGRNQSITSNSYQTDHAKTTFRKIHLKSSALLLLLLLLRKSACTFERIFACANLSFVKCRALQIFQRIFACANCVHSPVHCSVYSPIQTAHMRQPTFPTYAERDYQVAPTEH